MSQVTPGVPRFGFALSPVPGVSGIFLGCFRVNFGALLGIFGSFGVIFWCHFGWIFGVIFGDFLGIFLCNFG